MKIFLYQKNYRAGNIHTRDIREKMISFNVLSNIDNAVTVKFSHHLKKSDIMQFDLHIKIPPITA